MRVLTRHVGALGQEVVSMLPDRTPPAISIVHIIAAAIKAAVRKIVAALQKGGAR